MTHKLVFGKTSIIIIAVSIVLLSGIIIAAQDILGQFDHGLGAKKSCKDIFVGQHVDCSWVSLYGDDFNDTIRVGPVGTTPTDTILGITHTFASGKITIVAAGTVGVGGSTTCVAGGTLPCTVSGIRHNGVTLGEGFVRFSDKSFILNSSGTVTDTATIPWRDLCDSSTTQGCNSVDNQLATAGASMKVFSIGTVLTKTADRIFVNPNETINYTYDEHNNGTAALNSPTITDDHCSPVTPILGVDGKHNFGDTNNNGVLDPSEHWKFTCSFKPTSCSEDPIVNTATSKTTVNATATSVNLSNQPVPAVPDELAKASVRCLVPSTVLTKTPNVTFINPNENITYSYDEHNSGNVALNPPTITDDLCSPVTPVLAADKIHNIGDTNNSTLLDPSEHWKFTCTFTVPLDCSSFHLINGVATITNNATSKTTVADPFSAKTPPTDEHATANVACLDPHTVLKKTIDAINGQVLNGLPAKTFTVGALPTNITYTYHETNTGNIGLNPPTVTDDKCSPVTPVTSGGFNVGDTNQDNLLSVGETWVFHCTTAVIAGTSTDCSPTLVNTATSKTTVAAPFSEKTPPPDEKDSATLTCGIASTKLTKTPNVTFINPNETITYTYDEHNNGTVALNPPTITDDLCSPVTPVTVTTSTGTFNVGDSNQNGLLDPSEHWKFTCTFTPLSCNFHLIHGIATITNNATSTTTAAPPFQQAIVKDEHATANVACLNPQTVLTKTIDFVSPFNATQTGTTLPTKSLILTTLPTTGVNVTYTYHEANTGNVNLTAPILMDTITFTGGSAQCSPITPTSGNSGDTNNDGLLSVGETWVFHCSTLIFEGQCPTIINNVNSTTTVAPPFSDKKAPAVEKDSAKITCQITLPPRMNGGGRVNPDNSTLFPTGPTFVPPTFPTTPIKQTVVKTITGTYILTHGYELHCDPTVNPNNLQINFPHPKFGFSISFHLERLDLAFCKDNFFPAPIPPPVPPGPLQDTYTGAGEGRLIATKLAMKVKDDTGCGARAFWTFTDGDQGTRGEPGKNDRIVNLAIYAANGTLFVRWDGNVFYGKGTPTPIFPGYFLQVGNQQFLPFPNPPNAPLNTRPCSLASLGPAATSLTPAGFTGSIPGVFP